MPPRRVEAQHIEGWCMAAYGLAGQATALTGEVDLNFRFDAADGRRFVAKLSHAGEDEAVLHLQASVLQRLAEVDPLLPVPRLVPARSGAPHHLVETDAGEARLLRLLTWLDGTPMHQVPVSDTTRRNVGALAARIGLALRGLSHPAERRALRWDMQQAKALSGWLEALAPDVKPLPQLVFDRFAGGFLPIQDSFRAGLAHNDLNLYNLLVDPADGSTVAGCIDFGDCVKTAYVIDLAVAASYQAAAAPDPVGAIIAMAKAYHEVFPLTAAEMDWLVDLVGMRAAMTVIITHHSSRETPDNAPYLLRNEPAARALLEALCAVPRMQARERVRDELGSAA